LEHHAKSAKDAKVRVQALWTLRGLNALTSPTLTTALGDSDDRVREHALRLSEGGPPSEPWALVNDPAARVRYQLAFTLGESHDPRSAEALVKLAGDEDENIRNAALSSAPSHAKAMLPLVEKLPASDRARTSLPMLQKLVANPPALARPASIIERTNTIPAEQRAERAKVLSRFADVPKLRGDSKNGATLFKQQCAQCHRLRGEGVEVGPDLGMMVGKPVEQIVVAILDPNAAVETRYQNFSVTTKDDHEVSGIIIAETPTTLTLRAPNRADETLLRSELKELSAGGMSLMPDGLESAFTPQQLADLIAFVLGK
jgi:putative heme-binding domain-containing protein